jgi:hypothetical protein
MTAIVCVIFFHSLPSEGFAIPASLNTKTIRQEFNFLLTYRGSGACITYSASDRRKERIEVLLKLAC